MDGVVMTTSILNQILWSVSPSQGCDRKTFEVMTST